MEIVSNSLTKNPRNRPSLILGGSYVIIPSLIQIISGGRYFRQGGGRRVKRQCYCRGKGRGDESGRHERNAIPDELRALLCHRSREKAT